MDESLAEALRNLSNTFIARLPGKLDEIHQSLMEFQRDPSHRENLVLLHRLFHTMAGAAGTFGFPDMGSQARVLESKIKSLLSGESWTVTASAQFMQEVQTYIKVSASYVPAQVETAVVPPQPVIVSELETPAKKLIYFADEEVTQVSEALNQLEQFAYDVEVIPHIKELEAALKRRKPDFLVVDIDCGANRFAGADEIERLKRLHLFSCVTIFVSSSNGFENRLRAVRAGGDAFFSKPLDIVALTEVIDELIAHQQSKEYRILIVDDDADTAAYYRSILLSANMQVEVLTEPSLMLESMANFRPELILMDVYMPDCDGVELTRIVRQDRSFLDIPIVFLSSESDVVKQMEAVKVGADGFLVKPIVSDLLISSVATRAERYRALRTLVMRDGLTGLFNHTAIKESLIAKISGASRESTEVSLAMLDLDNFKSVNDTYGHPVGDQVLRSLAQLLKQRLRKSDMVGRYGGEEFVVIFPNTNAETARVVLEKIREAFSKILHFSEKCEFTVSFSAGVADTRQSLDPEELLTMADAALYRAKNSGKNRIVLGANGE